MKTASIAIVLTAAAMTVQTEANGAPEYHDTVRELRDTMVWLSDGTAGAVMEAVETRFSLPEYRDRQGQSHEEAGVTWSASGDRSVYYSATLSPGNDDAGHIGDFRYVLVAVRRHTLDGVTTLFSKKLSKDISFDGGSNSICAEIMPGEGKAEIYCGNHELYPVATIDFDIAEGPVSTGLCATGTADVSLAVTDSETAIDDTHPRVATDREDFYGALAAGGCTAEGVWRYLDRENDEHFGRPGGLYTLAVAADSAGGFDIVYVDGAVTNREEWREGMVKGHLAPTRFRGNYNMTWYDSDFRRIDSECYAQVDESGQILTLSFPLLKSQMRFTRCRGK